MDRRNASSARVYWVCASSATGANELAQVVLRRCASCAGSYTGQLEQRTDLRTTGVRNSWPGGTPTSASRVARERL